MFDYNNPNAMRKPMMGGADMIPSQFAPVAAPPPFMEMPPPTSAPQGGGMNAGSMQSLMGLGQAFGGMMEQRNQAKQAGGRTDSPMPNMKRQVPFAPPFEANA